MSEQNENANEEQPKKLGFGSSPDELTFIFVGGDEDDESGSCWYTRNFDSGINSPIESRAITGFISKLLISKSEYKNKVNYKLNIRLKADKRYSIRAGINTMFSRGFLLAFEKFLDDNDPKKTPITIAVRQGEDKKVIFCSLFNTEDNQKIFVEWDKDRDLIELTQELQEELGQQSQTMDMINNPEKYRTHQEQPGLHDRPASHTEEDDDDRDEADRQADEIFGPAKDSRKSKPRAASRKRGK